MFRLAGWTPRRAVVAGVAAVAALGGAVPVALVHVAVPAAAVGSVPVVAIAAGGSVSCALTRAGGVQCWGDNSLGQLGDGTTTTRYSPADVIGLTSGVAAIAIGDGHACALTTVGGVKCWGWNSGGQLGDGTTNDSLTPVDVSGLSSGVTAISAGQQTSCALTAAGGVKCWGQNGYGLGLGDGTTNFRSTPVDVSGLTSGVTAMSASGGHTCAVLSGGGVKCWGWNFGGQLGDGTYTDRLTPVDVVGLAGAVAITAGGVHTCVITTVGGVKCWGLSNDGRLGDDAVDGDLRVVDVVGMTSGVVAVSAGAESTCALTAAGGVKCWGRNAAGDLGDGTGVPRFAPTTAVPGLSSGVVAIASSNSNIHTCVLTVVGHVLCWGADGSNAPTQRSTPITAGDLSSGAATVSTGSQYSCVLMTVGGVKCFGAGGSGQLGNDLLWTNAIPVDVSSLSGVVDIGAGYEETCALTNGGGVKCWGNIGVRPDTSADVHTTPVDIPGLTSGVAALSVGYEHACVLTTAGGVKCWGFNLNGELGDGTTTNRWTPADVTGLTSGVLSISAGFHTSCAVTTSHAAKCWGNNDLGQLGDGTTTEHHTPVVVSGLGSGVASISAGAQLTCARTTAGAAQCWGDNVQGQLGDGTTIERHTPVGVSGLGSGVASIVAGDSPFAGTACAITTLGALLCWGANGSGQLGDGTTTDRPTPAPVSGLTSGVDTVAEGNGDSCAVQSTAVRCWGANIDGQIGDSEGWLPLLVPGQFSSEKTAPTISLTAPANDAYYVVDQTVNASYSCTDTGGSGLATCNGTLASGTAIDTSSVGDGAFTVTASDQAGNTSSITNTYHVVPPNDASVAPTAAFAPQPSVVSLMSAVVVTTDSGATGPTTTYPLQTTVASPTSGAITIGEVGVTEPTPSGFTIIDLQSNVSAPAATAASPLQLTFDLDASVLPSGATKDTVSVLKNDALVSNCPGATVVPAGATACVSDRADAPSGGGDIRLTVISLSGSSWNFAVGSPVPPTVSISNAQAFEGNSGTKVLNFSVTLSKPSALPVSVHYATANGFAIAGSDYTAASATLSFSPGQSLRYAPVTITGDTVHEANETFRTMLSAPSGATLLHPTGTGTILNDDPTVPSAPASAVAAPGNAQATLSWSAPLQNGGSAITGYVATPYVGTTAQTALKKTFAASARTGIVSGLTNGTTYTFRLTATNVIGIGPAASTVAIKVGTPTAPRLPTASPTASTSAVVRWTTPAAANAGSLTGYRVNAYAGPTLAKTVTVGLVNQTTIGGLVNGTTYTFRIAALNTIGTGPDAAPTSPIIVGAPGAPTGVTSTPDLLNGARANVHWTAPSTNGGAAITGYLVTPYVNGVAKPTRKFVGSTTTQTVNVQGLTPGATFVFKIAAINTRGSGPQSTASNTSKVK